MNVKKYVNYLCGGWIIAAQAVKFSETFFIFIELCRDKGKVKTTNTKTKRQGTLEEECKMPS